MFREVKALASVNPQAPRPSITTAVCKDPPSATPKSVSVTTINKRPHFEAELPPLKRNVVTVIFICILDDYDYVLDAEFKVFDDDASNHAWEIQSDIALEV